MIVFAHLLNDRSGSPHVLKAAIGALNEPSDRSRLFVGSEGAGCLDEVDINTTHYWYRRTPYRSLTLFTYLVSQLCLFFRLLTARGIDCDAVVYINTLLPFGAALYGRMTGRRVIYHLHEVSVSPAPLRWLLTTIARHTARRLIYVSDFHRTYLPIGELPAITVHNALDDAILTRAQESPYRHRREGHFTVLMLASLRDYKGVPEFLALAERVADRPDIRFELVANEDETAIGRYFSHQPLPASLTVHPRTSCPADYYSRASLVVNLSRPDLCVETFGLTLLEAMAFGLPVIGPPVGGPAELVGDGCEGFLVDSRHEDELAAKVLRLADDEALCLRLSAAARSKADQFTPEKFARNLRNAMKD